ncbi:hypothetical protein [Citrobacter youngae]|uniref:hypothetical protein n=1 Tax=Citrobacter youngae TaxID=133448 RepID=UPI0029B38479|nr:hypothetical protein [Salmonella enterica]HEI1635505.1 hypothetical protein [Escherichia coli]
MQDVEARNALRNIARRCNEEISAKRKANPGMNCDEIARPIFNGAMGMVKQLGFTPSHLYLEVGILNKRIKER